MRVDKYLWTVRYYKTRNMATEAAKKGHIRVNDQTAKPSREVYPGDTLIVRRDQIDYKLQIIALPENRVGAKLVDQYRKDLTPAEAFAHAEMLKLAKDYYRKKGTGRPTKKDRRSIEDFLEDESPAEDGIE